MIEEQARLQREQQEAAAKAMIEEQARLQREQQEAAAKAMIEEQARIQREQQEAAENVMVEEKVNQNSFYTFLSPFQRNPRYGSWEDTDSVPSTKVLDGYNVVKSQQEWGETQQSPRDKYKLLELQAEQDVLEQAVAQIEMTAEVIVENRVFIEDEVNKSVVVTQETAEDQEVEIVQQDLGAIYEKRGHRETIFFSKPSTTITTSTSTISCNIAAQTKNENHSSSNANTRGKPTEYEDAIIESQTRWPSSTSESENQVRWENEMKEARIRAENEAKRQAFLQREQEVIQIRAEEEAKRQAFLKREQEEAMAKHRQEMIEMERRRPHHFDSSMCAEHISLLPSTSGYNISVEQCARNMWGSALSSKPLRPSSGVHQWAVRLDKCDSGLVVVGVASANASVDRFIGGNSFSWGVVGTMALWHANTKVKSDYGNTFRTGAVVVATLDTDAGTLRFGLVSDVEAIKSLSSMDVISSDYIEDWGVAFEDLPTNTDLYPAVSLYHRDDKITLLSNVFDNDDTVGDSRSLVSALSSASSLPEEGLTRVDVAKPQEELDATRAVFEIESDKQVQERELALVGQGRAATLGKRH